MELDIYRFLHKTVKVEWKTEYAKLRKKKAVGELRQGNDGKLHLHVGRFYYIIGVEDVLSIKVVEK